LTVGIGIPNIKSLVKWDFISEGTEAPDAADIRGSRMDARCGFRKDRGSVSTDVKELVRKLYEDFWTAGDDSVADEIIAPSFLDHHVPTDYPRGPAGLRQWAANTRGGFPDFEIEIHTIVAEGDWVACHIEFGGTQTGEFNGIPPTGNRAGAQAISMFRVEGGQLIESWEFADVPAFLKPLGLVLGPANG
jgi:predicted ester cyclase